MVWTPPPLWKFQFVFILSSKKLSIRMAFETPPPPPPPNPTWKFQCIRMVLSNLRAWWKNDVSFFCLLPFIAGYCLEPHKFWHNVEKPTGSRVSDSEGKRKKKPSGARGWRGWRGRRKTSFRSFPLPSPFFFTHSNTFRPLVFVCIFIRVGGGVILS